MKIYYKKFDVLLWHMVVKVATCIVLYNMCIIGKDKFDIEWIFSKIKKMNSEYIIDKQ